MITKKILILIFILFIILIGSFGIWYINNNIHSLWNTNIINVYSKEPLQKEKVRIYFGVSVNTINRDDDLSLFDNMEKYIVLFDGEKVNEIEYEYGENDFLITYGDEYYFAFRQFKTYSKAQHSYNFYFREKENKSFIQVKIEGAASMEFERPMIPIIDAEKYRCNVPKAAAGVIYNMVELVDK